MKVLVINCGSSTLKFKVIELTGDTPPGQETRIAHGGVDRIGDRGMVKFIAENGAHLQKTERVTDHSESALLVLDWLNSLDIRFDAVGHRVVHGGHLFTEPVFIDDEVANAIDVLKLLAPLHNEPSLMAIHAVRKILGSKIPMTAVFDTTFHSNMPERSSYLYISREVKAHYTSAWERLFSHCC